MASDHPEQSEQDNTETELQKIEELKIEVIVLIESLIILASWTRS